MVGDGRHCSWGQSDCFEVGLCGLYGPAAGLAACVYKMRTGEILAVEDGRGVLLTAIERDTRLGHTNGRLAETVLLEQTQVAQCLGWVARQRPQPRRADAVVRHTSCARSRTPSLLRSSIVGSQFGPLHHSKDTAVYGGCIVCAPTMV